MAKRFGIAWKLLSVCAAFALPIIVMLLVYLTSPDYIELLWTEALGRVMLVCSAVWMFIGIMVMRKMINFDF